MGNGLAFIMNARYNLILCENIRSCIILEKLPYDIVKDRLCSLGYKMITKEDEYKDTQQNIICEKDGLKSFCSVSDILTKKGTSKRFFSLSNPFCKENMIKHLNSIDKDAEVLEIKQIRKGDKKRILLTIKCSCGEIFTRTWDDARAGVYGTKCQKCVLKSRGKSHRENISETVKAFEDRGYKIIGNSDEILRNVPIEVETSDGYRGFISYNRIRQGRNFEIFGLRQNKKNFIHNANVWSKLNGIGTEVLDFCDDKKFTQQGIKCKCYCGNEFVTSIASFQSGKNKCNVCSASNSRYERMVEKLLQDNNIEYIPEYRINSCKDILPLPFDFYIKQSSKLIEIDGQGHYQPCYFNNMNEENAKKSFEATVKHDKIKTDYCKKYNISLLRIPYWEMDNGLYKDKIIQFIKD
jgi:hypothetical protein